MHDCPECDQACDCEDTRFENVTNCTHECEVFDDDDFDPVDEYVTWNYDIIDHDRA